MKLREQIRFMFDDFAMIIRALGHISIASITANVTKVFHFFIVSLSIHYIFRWDSNEIRFIFDYLLMVTLTLLEKELYDLILI